MQGQNSSLRIYLEIIRRRIMSETMIAALISAGVTLLVTVITQITSRIIESLEKMRTTNISIDLSQNMNGFALKKDKNLFHF